MTRDKQLQNFIFHCNGNLKNAQKVLDDWEKKFDRNPLEAFTWSGPAFPAAAEVMVYKGVLECMNSANEDKKWEVFEGLIRVMQSSVMHSARYPEHSSSATSNLASSAVTSVQAELVEKMQWIIKEKE